MAWVRYLYTQGGVRKKGEAFVPGTPGALVRAEAHIRFSCGIPSDVTEIKVIGWTDHNRGAE